MAHFFQKLTKVNRNTENPKTMPGSAFWRIVKLRSSLYPYEFLVKSVLSEKELKPVRNLNVPDNVRVEDPM